MNKILATAAIVGTAIVSPIVGMGIGETREAILGLAPEDAIVQLADRIDQSSSKSDESAILVNSLQSKIAEQDLKIAEYETKLNTQEIEQRRVSSTISSQSLCSKLSTEQPICLQDSRYQTKQAFDKMLDELEIDRKEKDRRTSVFNKCQEILQACR